MKKWFYLVAFFVVTVLAPSAYLAADVFQSSNDVTITALVLGSSENPETPESPSSGGGNGGVSATANPIAQDERALVHIEGYTFPGAKVQLSVSGLPSDSWFAGDDGFFSRDFRAEAVGNLVFSFSAHTGRYWTSTSTYTLPVQPEQILDLGYVLLSPVMQSEDNLSWLGFSIPSSEVTVWVNDEEKQTLIASSVDGSFNFLLDNAASGNLYLTCTWEGETCGTSLIYVLHGIQSTDQGTDSGTDQNTDQGTSQGAQTESGSEVSTGQASTLLSDINEDGKVNYVDFGLMREAYLDQSYDPLVDLDYDGTLNLLDFSLLAYQWTIP